MTCMLGSPAAETHSMTTLNKAPERGDSEEMDVIVPARG